MVRRKLGKLMQIRRSDLSEYEVIDLLELHTREMLEGSPPGTSFALDLSGLQLSEVTVYAAWNDAALLAIGALRHHDCFAEIKSMRAHPAARGKGAGKAMLMHLIAQAKNAGFSSIKLETGTGELFEPALGLYRATGFEPCGSFAGYTPSEFNQFFALDI